MADLSVTEVQAHLRNFAESGHDSISRPGSFVFKGKPFMSYGSGLYLPSQKKPTRVFLSTLIPVGESGNVAETYAGHTRQNGNNRDITPRTPDDGTREQVGLLHPQSITETSTGNVHHSYFYHPDGGDYVPDGPHLDDPSQPMLLKAVQNMGKAKAHYKTATVDDLRNSRGTTYPALSSELKNHNSAQASWHWIASELNGPSQIPHIPEKRLPKDIDIRNIGQFVHVFDDETGSSYLYHTDSERMVKIK